MVASRYVTKTILLGYSLRYVAQVHAPSMSWASFPQKRARTTEKVASVTCCREVDVLTPSVSVVGYEYASSPSSTGNPRNIAISPMDRSVLASNPPSLVPTLCLSYRVNVRSRYYCVVPAAAAAAAGGVDVCRGSPPKSCTSERRRVQRPMGVGRSVSAM